MAIIKLRTYQERAIIDVYNRFSRGDKRVILFSMMGSGKTEMACYMTMDAVRDGVPVVIVVRGRELVKNISERLSRYKIDHSVYMAGHYKLNKAKMVQVCSIDTLISRNDFPFSDRDCLVILDEQHKDYAPIYNAYPYQWTMGMSATPFGDNSKWDNYIVPITPIELLSDGVLVPTKTYCPNIMDTSQLKIVAGDFQRKQVESLVTQSAIVGNIVEDWKKYSEERPTVCFCVTVEHSKQLADAFNRSGIPALHCDANSSDIERKKAKDGLESGKIKVVCNVDIFSVGWDCPIVSCIILARPTWSTIWYLQAIGRGIRSADGKSDCIVIDSAGNILRHGSIFKERKIDVGLTKKEKKKYENDLTVRSCQECYFTYESTLKCCPACGVTPPVKEVKQVDGELSLYNETDEERDARRSRECKILYYKLDWVRKTRRLPLSFIERELYKKFGDDYKRYLSNVTKSFS